VPQTLMSPKEQVRMTRINLMYMESRWHGLDRWDTYCTIHRLRAVRADGDLIIEFVDL